MTTSAKLEISTSRQFTSWLAEQHVSLAFTTYQAGKLFLVGLQPDGRVSVFERTFARCMGLCAHGRALYMSALYQVWRFEDSLGGGGAYRDYDRLYVPQLGYTTGDLDVHDIAVEAAGEVVFVNTLFSCLGLLSETHSFIPVWRPEFISKLAAEDRCHLNGLAMEAGRARYVSAVSCSDVADGWRDHRRDGGCIIDVDSGEVVFKGLSMPHSPRLYRERLWVLDSGNGYVGHVDLDAGRFEPVTFCPGYLRGLSFVGDFAVVGLSRPRHDGTFAGLALDAHLRERGAEARCGVHVIDLRTGDAVHWLRIEGVVEELYDVVVLPGVRRPMALGFKTDEIRRTITIGEPPARASMGTG